jgi:hypothetical protein
MRARCFIAAATLLIALAGGGCGGGDDETEPTTALTQPEMGPAAPPAAEVPEAADGDHEDHEGAAGEASPEAPATGPETGELSGEDDEEVAATVAIYVSALNRHDGAATCSVFGPGALQLSELPVRRGGCVPSLQASIGSRPAGGGPAWRRTRLVEVSAVSVEGGGARVTGTVIHRFRGDRQPSTEEDVIYLERVGGRWLLAKPSATFYRAVGYADPPLRALTPP